MSKTKPDYYVGSPSIFINSGRTAVFVRFEQIDPETREGIGTDHLIAMTTADAMRLLGLLETMQTKFDLPKIVSEPEHIHVPKKKEQN